MNIPENEFIKYEAEKITFYKNDIIYQIGNKPSYFFYVKTGRVVLQITNDDLKECIIKVFNNGQSFGEAALLGGFNYPTDAIAECKSNIWRMIKEKFIEMLVNNPDIHFDLTRLLCERLHYKTNLINHLSCHNAEHRIMNILDFYKTESGINENYEFPFTRDKLAKMTGIRIETAIRSVKKLETEGKLRIINNKIYI